MTDVVWLDREAFFRFTFEWPEFIETRDSTGVRSITRDRQVGVDGWVRISIPSDHPDAYDPSAFRRDIRKHAEDEIARLRGITVPADAVVTFASIEPRAGYLDKFQTGTRPITKES